MHEAFRNGNETREQGGMPKSREVWWGVIGRGSMGGVTSNGAGEGEERQGRQERRERKEKRRTGDEQKEEGRREKGRECKDRGNKRSTEMHLVKWEQVTRRTQISFSVCDSRRGRTGVGGRPRLYPGDQRSEAVRTRTGAEAAQGVGSLSCGPGGARRLR